MDSCWDSVVQLTAGWERRTYQSPRDQDDFPMTRHLWPLCRDNGQQADLVRIEVLYRDGGVYVDADVQLLRPLDSLLTLDAFAGWEDGTWLCNAVMGSTPEHPALLAALERMEWWLTNAAPPSGPRALTEAWQGRDDVTLLPTPVFYPYRYDEPHRAGEDFTLNLDTIAVHHWAKSWN
jgi:mannosyltransferase OCH1-like enzyme